MKSVQEQEAMDRLNEQATAARRCLSIPKLTEFTKSEFVQIRRAAAVNPNSNPSILMIALSDPDISVRRRAAKNPRADEAVLMFALRDGDIQVRCCAAKNSRATDKVIGKALRNKYGIVRESAVFNTNISPAMLVKALDDKDYLVSSSAADILYDKLISMGILDSSTDVSWTKEVANDPLLRLSVLAKVQPVKKSRKASK